MYRLIIADDEMIECMVLEHIFRHEMSDRIEVLDSVQDGIALLEAVEEQKPDIAIVDINMPGLGGLDAIELLQAKQIKLKIIIHSAYSEFSYAQRALQLGAADYLVKPNLKEEMVASVKKICRMLEAEEERRTAYVSQEEVQHTMQELACGRWMMSLLLEQPDEESYHRIRNGFPDASSGGIFTVWEAAAESETTLEKVAERTNQEMLINLEKRLASLCSHVCLRHENVLYCLLFPGKKVRSGDWKAWLFALIRCVHSGQDKAGDDSVSWIVGVSTWKDENDFLSGLHEAQAALWHRSQSGIYFYLENESREQGSSGKGAQGQKDWLLPEMDKRLAGYVLERKEEEGARELLQMISRIPVPSYGSPEEAFLTCKIGAAFFLLSVEEELEKLSAKKEWATGFWKSFRDVRTQEELRDWCKEKFFGVADLFHQSSEENLHIFHVYALVSQNFSRDLPLEEIAQKIGISPFYLSRLLKQKKRTTFVEIVTDIRIRKAVMLLVRSHKAVREIAVSVGYPNQSYFYRVFKKTTGIAVGDIRKYLW